MTTQKEQSTICQPQVDYVIVFDPKASPSNFGQKTKASKKDDDKASKQSSLTSEYENLLGVLRKSGLEVTGRPGAKGTGQVLIFVRATEGRIQAEVHRERLSDWLHGVASTRPSPRSPRDFASEPITPAERLRLVYSILTSPLSSTNSSVTTSASAGPTAGLTPLPSPKSFPHVTAIFPPHDRGFNSRWLKLWSSTSHAFKPIPRAELDEIKDHHGEKIALYFAFLRYYFSSLLYPALVGIGFYFCGLSYSPYYAIGIVIWSVFFIESWRVQERKLSVEWGTHNIHTVEVERSAFVGDSQVVDPVTGVQHAHFPFYKTFIRQLMTIPVVLTWAFGLACLISTIYAIETLVGEVYQGSMKKYLTLVPTILFAGVVPQVIALWGKTARRLTSFENHPHQSQYEQSLTLKVFALNFFVAYGSLTLTSYIYIPFGSILVPYILSLLPSKHAQALSADPTSSFSINSSKLHTQVVALTLTSQIIGSFTEVILPLLMRKAKKEVVKVQEKRAGANSPKNAAFDELEEHAFLERMRDESQLPEYVIFDDYAEMVLQFGYQTLFSVIWPIAPVFAFLNNFLELRSDAFKITSQFRRPIPQRVASIGPWLDVLGFISYLAAFTNASLVYLYQPQMSYPSATASYLSDVTQTNVTLPTNGTLYHSSRIHLASVGNDSSTSFFNSAGGIPPNDGILASIRSTLFSALLIALFAEHIYLVFRGITRFILHRVSWIDSSAHNHIRRNGLELRRAYLDEMGLRKGPQELAEESGMLKEAKEGKKNLENKDEAMTERFWSFGAKGDGKMDGKEDKGLQELKRLAKAD